MTVAEMRDLGARCATEAAICQQENLTAEKARPGCSRAILRDVTSWLAEAESWDRLAELVERIRRPLTSRRRGGPTVNKPTATTVREAAIRALSAWKDDALWNADYFSVPKEMSDAMKAIDAALSTPPVAPPPPMCPKCKGWPMEYEREREVWICYFNPCKDFRAVYKPGDLLTPPAAGEDGSA